MENKEILQKIKDILKELKKDYKLPQNRVSVNLKYRENYISEQVSKKKSNPVLLKKLQEYQIKVAEEARNPAPEILEIVKELKADIAAIRQDVAEIKDKLNKK
jgi:HEPN domain-containing protein